MASPKSDKKVAIVLCGCGVYDGSETTEVVSALIHLSRAGVEVSAFAPNKDQMHVVNHLTGEEETSGENRNVLVESARIARGNVKALDECNAGDFDALVIPGGFGAAKNLSDYASKGADLTVDSTLEEIMRKFHTQGKPIGLSCIAPTIAAKVFGSTGCKLTVGSDVESEKYPFAGAAGAIKSLGAQHQTCEPNEACIDKENKIVSSSAYMYAGLPHEIDDSVRAMVEGVLSLLV
mmetsp:Transcript_38900/g.81363  ORF Transcript_38900/g.81363 Transcript_38900/m.81363 type:complete len:235 (+) Transcript_38900:24-728(+)